MNGSLIADARGARVEARTAELERAGAAAAQAYVMALIEEIDDLSSALGRLHIAAENFYRGRGYLDSFRLKCALNGTRDLARDE